MGMPTSSRLRPFRTAVSDAGPATTDFALVASTGSADTGIPVDTVHTFAQGMTVSSGVKVYDGAAHAFCD